MASDRVSGEWSVVSGVPAAAGTSRCCGGEPPCSPGHRARRLAAVVLVFSALLAGQTTPAAADYPYSNTHPEKLKFAPLEFHPPEAVKKALPNGLTLYLLEDHELPLFNAIAYVKTGSIYEPADKVGLAALTGTVMRTGGTEKRTGDEIDEALEFVGGSVETSIGAEYASARVSTLKKDADTGLEVLAGVLRQPAFRPEKLELAKQQAIEGIRRKNDQPGEIVGRVFSQAVYGKESPWAREPTIAGIRAITREDLVAFHDRSFAPNNTVVAVAGDMTADEMAQRIEKWLGDWERKPVDLPAVAPVPQAVTPEVILVPKDVTQVNLRMGHLGLPRFGPDHYAVQVMNYILGAGGFSSRLMREVRANRGLAYAVWGYLGEGRDRGTFEMGAETRVETAPQGVQAMRETLEGLVAGPITPAELAAAKDALLNSFVFAFQSRFQIASRKARYDILGFPPDYLETYSQRIGAVKVEDVQRAAKAHLHPGRMVTVAVGPQAALEKPLGQFGTVRVAPLAPPE